MDELVAGDAGADRTMGRRIDESRAHVRNVGWERATYRTNVLSTSLRRSIVYLKDYSPYLR